MPKALVKVSPKFQVVIPKEIRQQLELKAGEALQVYILDGSIRMHRPRSIKDLRGIAKGMQWKDDYRDHTERF
jgi:AbrB family looped-hinge helix DNA binding protein